MGRACARMHRIRRFVSLLCAGAIAVTSLACFKAVNVPLAQYDPDYGYHPSQKEIRRERGEMRWLSR